MAEYLERETVLADEITHCLPYSVGKAAGRVVVFAEDIEAIPAADVAPVRHGRWVVGKDHGDFGEAKCTACGGILLVKWSDRLSEYRYCPNCGALMDLEGGDGNG